MTCAQQLAAMPLEKLYGVRGFLEDSRDINSAVALRMVETEIRLRRRFIRDNSRIVHF